MSRPRINLTTDTIVSFSAIVIAIASVIVTVWQGVETRKHDRLSVRPSLAITFESSRDGFGYVLTNNGLGPAIITGRRFFLGDEPVRAAGFSGYDELVDRLGLAGRTAKHSSIYPGMTIPAGDAVDIIRFAMNEGDDPEVLLPEVYGRVRIEIEYRSMYDEPFVIRIPD